MTTLLYRDRRTRSGRSLANLLEIPTTKRTRSRFAPRDGATIINWGCSEDPYQLHADAGTSFRWINHPAAVHDAVCKLRTFTKLSAAGRSVVQWTTDVRDATAWLLDGCTVIVRTRTRASAGAGIHVSSRNIAEGGAGSGACGTAGELLLPPAPLYTRYFKGRDEYRVHVGSGTVIDVQKKRVRRGTAGDVDYTIRTHGNGFVFCREDVHPPSEALSESVLAVEALGLDFGAVDIKHNEVTGEVAVLEVNTAPGLEGTTLERYANYLRGEIAT